MKTLAIRNFKDMLIYFGADHRGFNLKAILKDMLTDLGYEIYDIGNEELDPDDDYPDFAAKAGREVSLNPEGSRAVLICGSGVGMAVTAGKFPQVRPALSFSTDHIFDARNHDDVNVLCLASDFVTEDDARNILKIFLQTPFDASEKRKRRLRKIAEVETENHSGS